VAEEVGELGDKTLTVLGHWVYVRKCVRPDPMPIVLPDAMRDTGDYIARLGQVEVLAIGAKVGERRTQKQKELVARGWARQQVPDFKVGDIVLVPERSQHLWRSAINKADEFFIDEAEIRAVLVFD
jgi:hypothetical protein